MSPQMKADYAYMVDNSQHLVVIAMGTTEDFASDDIDLAALVLRANEIPVIRQGGLNQFIEILPRDVERARTLLLRYGRLKPYVDYAAPHVVRPLPTESK